MITAHKRSLIGRRSGPARLLGVLALAFSAWLWTAAAAFAHATLVDSSPADNAVLAEAPATFSLTFSEPVSPFALRLIETDRSSFSLERFELRDRTLEIVTPPSLGRGTHVLAWRVISEDGHPIAGSVIFSIGAASGIPPATAMDFDRQIRTAIWLTKVALYLGLFMGVGGTFAVTWLGRGERSGSVASLVLLGIGLVGAALSVGFQGLDALGAPIGRISDPEAWRAGMGTSFGRTAIVAVLASMIAICALAAKSGRGRLLSLAALAGTGVALALSGHASTAEPQWLTRPLVFLHAVGIAFWTGALIPLGLAFARRTPASCEMLRRFSGMIPLFVALLIVAGIVLTVVQVRTPTALVETAYGLVFLAKMALLILLFVLAAFNRWWLTMPAGHGDPAASRGLARSVAVETAIIILVFAVAATWRFTPPPRALPNAAAQPAFVHLHKPGAMANVQLSPAHVGQVTAAIEVFGKARRWLRCPIGWHLARPARHPDLRLRTREARRQG